MELKLSKKQKECMKLLLKNEGSFLRPSMTISGSQDFRLLDAKFNPLKKFTSRTVSNLFSFELLQKEGLEIKPAPGLTIDMFVKRKVKSA